MSGPEKIPSFSFPPDLPITAAKETIMTAIRENQVVVVAGDTGCGKTTQLAKMCLALRPTFPGRVGCTQPRRLAAVAVARRVAAEIGMAKLVGSTIRFRDRTSATTRIKFMTDGILLAESRKDPDLRQYHTLIIDEAHERSLNIDFLLGILKQLLQRRPELKLVISSATIDPDRFARHFNQAPIIHIPGRTHPITLRYEPIDTQESADITYVDKAVQVAMDICTGPNRGDILIFMPTERDIRDTITMLAGRLGDEVLLLPLFGRLPGRDQHRIFQQSPRRKIIVATNIAETSITVPNITFVVDTGLARQSAYNVRARTTSLLVGRISRASCDQRAGRCGRVGPGICIRLYSEDDYLSRPRFTRPEIQRANLSSVILQMVDLGLGDPRRFPFLDPPVGRAISEGYRQLRELGAIDNNQHLTERGRIMARLPLDPCLARIIIEGNEQGALREMLIIGAALSIQDPRVRPADQEEAARQAQQAFVDPGSDFLTLINIWDSYQRFEPERGPAARLRNFCRRYFLSWQRMREWFDVHDQLCRVIQRLPTFRTNSEPATPMAVHWSLASGFLRNIGKKEKKNVYRVSGDRQVFIFPGSSVYNRGPAWMVAAEFVETSRMFARTLGGVEPEWLETLGGTLCRRRWSDPVWEKKSGQVIGREHVTLFGLPLVTNRRVNYGRINTKTRAEARAIFIQEALLGGALRGRYDFLEHNLALATRLADLEERVRRRGILVDTPVLFAFYDQRLPSSVYDRFTLNRFLRRKKNDRFLRMSEELLCQDMPAADELYRFPPRLRTSQGKLALSYRFEPGCPADGVSVDIPFSLKDRLEGSQFEWLVPGLLPDKILALLKRLPKRLRRPLVPLPAAVDRLLDTIDHGQGSLYTALEQALRRCFQVTVQRHHWRADQLEPHLRMRFRLLDGQGRELMTSRSFLEIQRFGDQPSTGTPPAGHLNLPEKSGITTWDFAAFLEPRPLPADQGGYAYPTLVRDARGRSLRACFLADEQASRKANRSGLHLLYELVLPREIKAVRRECKAALRSHSASWLSLGVKGGLGEIQEQLLGFILDECFGCRNGNIPDKQTFTRHLDQRQGLIGQASTMITLLLELLATRRQVVMQIEAWAARSRKNHSFAASLHQQFQDQVNRILGPDFLQQRTLDELRHSQRYLRALALRLERAEQHPARDEAKARRLHREEERLRQLDQWQGSCSAACQEAMARYRFMVEEFRVSVFAPELRTAVPVSEKRLARQWQQVRTCCCQVE